MLFKLFEVQRTGSEYWAQALDEEKNAVTDTGCLLTDRFHGTPNRDCMPLRSTTARNRSRSRGNSRDPNAEGA